MTDDRSDYLWDRSGAPDPEVQQLEEILGTLRHRGSLPPLPVRREPLDSVPSARTPQRRLRVVFALTAAAVVCLVAGAWWFDIDLDDGSS